MRYRAVQPKAKSDILWARQGRRIWGTPGYVAPEAFHREGFSTASDLFALGVVLYECLAGAPPFAGASLAVAYRIVHEDPQSLRARGLELDEELDQIILGYLSKQTSDRP